jgi:hypothetical protein
VLSCPPSDAAINAFVDNYGDRFEIGQEWSISEAEVRYFAIAETVDSEGEGEALSPGIRL